jgi:hypothetical protein
MRASLLEPELRQAMVKALGWGIFIGREGPRVERASFVRNGRVERVRKVDVKRFVFTEVIYRSPAMLIQ